MTALHARVVNVRAAACDVYVGRDNRDPKGRGRWGNPWTVARYGDRAMANYIDWIDRVLSDAPRGGRFVEALKTLEGKVLGCWCAGRYPVCHAEVLARLADAGAACGWRLEELRAALHDIRADVMSRLQPQWEMFRG